MLRIVDLVPGENLIFLEELLAAAQGGADYPTPVSPLETIKLVQDILSHPKFKDPKLRLKTILPVQVAIPAPRNSGIVNYGASSAVNYGIGSEPPITVTWHLLVLHLDS